MNTAQLIHPQEIKKQSEKIILAHGGEILDWLPTIGLSTPRSLQEIIDRALVLNALFQLHLRAPKSYIANWIYSNNLKQALTPFELGLLESDNELTETEHFYLYWSLESLWTIAWATQLIEALPFDEEVGSELASLSPNLQINEDGAKYQNTMQLRPDHELYSMLDLYYRIHWWIYETYKQNRYTGEIILPAIEQRRKTLEWIWNNQSDWDSIDLSL